jgi:hypothetical protein
VGSFTIYDGGEKWRAREVELAYGALGSRRPIREVSEGQRDSRRTT